MRTRDLQWPPSADGSVPTKCLQPRLGTHIEFGTSSCRKVFFEDELGKAQREQEKQEKHRKRCREDFNFLLKDSRRIKYDTPWPEARDHLEKEPEFKAVSRIPLHLLFLLDDLPLLPTLPYPSVGIIRIASFCSVLAGPLLS